MLLALRSLWEATEAQAPAFAGGGIAWPDEPPVRLWPLPQDVLEFLAADVLTPEEAGGILALIGGKMA